MRVSNHSAVPVYTISGSDTARPLPEWLIRKRKRSLKKDPEFAHRVELLQDFEFDEASSCVRVSEDGDWLVSTGTYKPQMHVHYLPHLALSYSRHTKALNETFLLLSSDYSKSLHLQSNRAIEFHTPSGCHYETRIPRYGRDLVYDRQATEALIPSVGVNEDGNGEVFRLNLEIGRFMKGYDVDVGDDTTSSGAGSLQGGVGTGAVNTGTIAEESHNLLAFGTTLGTVEFWDSRSRSRVGVLAPPPVQNYSDDLTEITSLAFNRSGLGLASGTSNGLVHLYDLRSPVPLIKKDQGYGFPIKNLQYLTPSSTTRQQTSLPLVMSADKRIIKIWDERSGAPWTSVEPAVDLNHVEWCKDSGMFLTANEGKAQHSFFVPQLGPAPRWCAFLDNLVEEMAEDPNDPNAFGTQKSGEIYDNFKFLTLPQLRALSMDHLIGTTNLLRPYMHGYFVDVRLYEEARMINNPELWQEQRQKTIQSKIDKERESRIRGQKKASVKVNRRLAERIMEREERHERKKAKRVLEKGGDDDEVDGEKPALEGEEQPEPEEEEVEEEEEDDDKPTHRKGKPTVLQDPRFAKLFQDEDFEVDEESHEFKSINPSTRPRPQPRDPTTGQPRGLTAVEQEVLDNKGSSSESDSDSDDNEKQYRKQKEAKVKQKTNDGRISTTDYRRGKPKSNNQNQKPQMHVSHSNVRKGSNKQQAKSFGSRIAGVGEKRHKDSKGSTRGNVVGERELTFQPAKKQRPRPDQSNEEKGITRSDAQKKSKDRRNASGNVFRSM